MELPGFGDLLAVARTGVVRPVGPGVVSATVGSLVRGPGVDALLALHASEGPLRPALVTADRIVTWRDLRERVHSLAGWFSDHGLGAEGRLALVLGNRPGFVESAAAGALVGAKVMPVAPHLPADAMRDMLARIDPTVVVTDVELSAVPDGTTVLEMGEDYEAAVAQGRQPEETGGTPRFVLFTSGTTGRPKGAEHEPKPVETALAFVGLLREIPLRREDVHLVASPLYHTAGFGFAALSFALGSALAFPDGTKAEQVADAVERHRATTTVLVPTMLRRLLGWEGTGDRDLSTLRVAICTGAPLPPDLREGARDVLGDVIFDLYGAAEMGWVTVATPEDQRSHPDATGRVLPRVRVEVRSDEGEAVPEGEVGEIWVDSPMAMTGYLDDEELTDRRVRDGWVTVGDLGSLRDGVLTLSGRSDDMIVTGGLNVYPAEVEPALRSHPAVKDAAVLGVADPEWGERVVAIVVTDDGATPEAIRAHTRQRLPKAAVPKQVEIVDELPLTPLGKLDRAAAEALVRRPA
jgi:fatty-acyl-CoA synthase